MKKIVLKNENSRTRNINVFLYFKQNQFGTKFYAIFRRCHRLKISISSSISEIFYRIQGTPELRNKKTTKMQKVCAAIIKTRGSTSMKLRFKENKIRQLIFVFL